MNDLTTRILSCVLCALAVSDISTNVRAQANCTLEPTYGNSTAFRPRSYYQQYNAPVLYNLGFDYAPSVMYDGVYKAWWCGYDGIRYSTAPNLSGPWEPSRVVFRPSGGSNTFDRDDVCDPSVIRVKGVYYMYYSGFQKTDSSSIYYDRTNIGVASSSDGTTWTRLNNGNPIVRSEIDANGQGFYGAGQPSVIYNVKGDKNFYMLYTDTTALGPPHPRQQNFVVSSPDPLFPSGRVWEGVGSWRNYTGPKPSPNASLFNGASEDWMYVDAIDRFAKSGPSTNPMVSGEGVAFYDAALSRKGWVGFLSDTTTTEGAGFVRRADGHALAAEPGGAYTVTMGSKVPIDILRSVRNGPSDSPEWWDLAWAGFTIQTGRDFSCADAGRVLEGFQVSAPNQPLAVVLEGKRIQFANTAPANDIARWGWLLDSTQFYRIPYGASVYNSNQVLGAPGRPGAFKLDDNRLYPISCLDVVTHNNSVIAQVSTQVWDSYLRGPDMTCLR